MCPHRAKLSRFNFKVRYPSVLWNTNRQWTSQKILIFNITERFDSDSTVSRTGAFVRENNERSTKNKSRYYYTKLYHLRMRLVVFFPSNSIFVSIISYRDVWKSEDLYRNSFIIGFRECCIMYGSFEGLQIGNVVRHGTLLDCSPVCLFVPLQLCFGCWCCCVIRFFVFFFCSDCVRLYNLERFDFPWKVYNFSIKKSVKTFDSSGNLWKFLDSVRLLFLKESWQLGRLDFLLNIYTI